MNLGDYKCPICGWKVSDGGRLFMHDSKIGDFVVDRIEEYKRRFKELDSGEG